VLGTGIVFGSYNYGSLYVADIPITIMNYMQVIMQAYIAVQSILFLLITKDKNDSDFSYLVWGSLIIVSLNIIGFLKIMPFAKANLLEYFFELGTFFALFGSYLINKKKNSQLPEKT